MPYLNLSSTNLAQGLLDAGMTAGQTTFALQSGQGGLFPTTFPFRVLIQNLDSQKRPLKSEIATVTNRVGDVFTVTRASEAVPASYSATSQTSTAFAFSSGDSVSLVLTAGQQKDVQDEVERLETDKLDKAGATRTGLTASRIIKTDGSGNEAYVSPGSGGQFLADDLTFKSIESVDVIFGDGSDGDLIVASGVTNLVMGTVYNFSSIAIASGASVSTSSSNGTLILKCRGTTSGLGSINLSAK